MKPLMKWKGKPSGKQHWVGAMSAGVLAACVASVVWGQEPEFTPIPDAAALNTTVRNNLSSNYRLTHPIYV